MSVLIHDGNRWRANLGSEGRWLFEGAEQLSGSGSLHVPDFLVVEEADGGTAPYYPKAIVLHNIDYGKYTRIEFTPGGGGGGPPLLVPLSL